ncbi:hypothetical protein [Dermabacter hominis]|uniref:hypothetical protein n=1 Tax=Dermabacter hominis TaxID=36740 RepID=UPI00223BA7E1|nr:hypothetical protein [Dermabacter hominis]MCT2025902.1 hypothetical protein [Dermabacter hominis]
MKKKLWSTILACVSVAPLLLTLQGCGDALSTEIEADDSPQVLSEAWGIDVPASMTTEEFYSSDAGFTGDGDFIRVLKLPKADQGGTWSPDSFQETPDEWVGSTVITNSNAPFKLDDFSDLRCHPVTKSKNGDYLMLCYSRTSDNYYSFESYF